MKKIFTLMLASFMVLSFSAYAQTQDKKADRKARKEIRRQEKHLTESLRMLMEGSDSINIGYGYVKRNKATTPNSQRYRQKDISTYTDISDYIQSAEPGVMVLKAGGTTKYIIRGIGTNSEQTNPLLLVDGVQVDSFDGILPINVESIEVIKDGSASIYGMQGANGVIMLTTKKQ